MLRSEFEGFAGPSPRPEELIGGTAEERRTADIRRAEAHLPGNRRDRTVVTEDTDPTVTTQLTSMGRTVVFERTFTAQDRLDIAIADIERDRANRQTNR